MVQMKKSLFLITTILSGINVVAQTTNPYIVSTYVTEKTDTVINTQTPNQTQESQEKKSAEEEFLAKNFKYQGMGDWVSGMRFMVIPGSKDSYINTFRDAETGNEVGTGSLKYKILEYKGHNITDRGWIHFNFYSPDNNKNYYHEVRNTTFEDYCNKIKGGINALAYLGDVDKARELLIGKILYTRTDLFYTDDPSAHEGAREFKVAADQKVTVENIGVGTREYPVKMIVRDQKGNLFFQLLAMSKTNSGMRDDEFIMGEACHYFPNSFGFASEAGTKSAKKSQELSGKIINLRRSTTLESSKGTKRNFAKFTRFLVKEVISEANSEDATLVLGYEGTEYRKKVTFKNTNVAGNIDGYKEDYFYELFTIGTAQRSSNTEIVRTHSWAGMVSGMTSQGMSMKECRMSKGAPSKKWKNKNGTTVWQYEDGSKITFNSKGIAIKITTVE